MVRTLKLNATVEHTQSRALPRLTKWSTGTKHSADIHNTVWTIKYIEVQALTVKFLSYILIYVLFCSYGLFADEHCKTYI